MKQLIKRLVPHPLLQLLRRVWCNRHLTSSRHAARAVGNIDIEWRTRIDDAIASTDNAKIPRCQNAGQLEGYTITMHNGVRVCANGYCGDGILNLLIENKGVHEPQEEYAFEKIIRLLPDQCVMLELGAYWSFYSLSLLQQRPRAKCFMVEPDPVNIASGRINFRLNQRTGVFTQARVDIHPTKKPKTISVDSFCNEHGIRHLHILHSDIQGYELAMLEGASNLLTEGNVDYVFISTHSDKLHVRCLEKLRSLKYVILADANMHESYSVDGLIVAKHHSIKEPQSIEISKKTA